MIRRKNFCPANSEAIFRKSKRSGINAPLHYYLPELFSLSKHCFFLYSFDVTETYEASLAPIVDPVPRTDTKFENAERMNYVHHLGTFPTNVISTSELTCPFLLLFLGLYTPEEVELKKARMVEDRKRKFDYRNMILIPEFTEKKRRFNYAWLGSDQQPINSPPLLRTRRRNPNPLTNSGLTGRRGPRAKKVVVAPAAAISTTTTNSTRTSSPTPTGSEPRTPTPEVGNASLTFFVYLCIPK